MAFKKGVYYLIAHPSVKDIQELKGKKLGVSSIRGSDHLVAEELLRSKGFNPAQLQPVALGDTFVRLQSVITGAVEVTTLSPPHDLMAQQMGGKVLAGPPEVGMPASGMITSDRLIKENPQFVKRGVRALLKANRLDRRESSGNHSHTAAVGQADSGDRRAFRRRRAEVDFARRHHERRRHGEFPRAAGQRKKKALDDVRDFSFARQVWKELEAEQMSNLLRT